MRQTRNLVLLVVLAGSAIGAAAFLDAAGGGPPRRDLPLALNPTTSPPPPIGTVSVVNQPIKDPAQGFTLSPPPDGYEPGLRPEEALAQAWALEGAESITAPTRADLTLGILDWAPGFKELPVWLVTYEDTCVPIHGAMGPSCVKTSFNTLMDATTGDYIASHAESS